MDNGVGPREHRYAVAVSILLLLGILGGIALLAPWH